MANFSLREDWKYISWKGTLLTNLYRSIGAGMMFLILSFIFNMRDIPVWERLLWPLIFPVGYFVIFLPLGLITSSLSRAGVPYIGLISIVCSFLVFPGDPLVWIFDQATGHKYVPIRDFKFLNFAVVMFVIDEERKMAALQGTRAA